MPLKLPFIVVARLDHKTSRSWSEIHDHNGNVIATGMIGAVADELVAIVNAAAKNPPFSLPPRNQLTVDPGEIVAVDAAGEAVRLQDLLVAVNEGAEPCPLMHCHCGACGCAIADDGKCNCADNRAEMPARTERDLRSQYLKQIAALRKCETNDIPSFEDELAANATELERLRGLVRYIRAADWSNRVCPRYDFNAYRSETLEEYNARYSAEVASRKADYDAATEAMLANLETKGTNE